MRDLILQPESARLLTSLIAGTPRGRCVTRKRYEHAKNLLTMLPSDCGQAIKIGAGDPGSNFIISEACQLPQITTATPTNLVGFLCDVSAPVFLDGIAIFSGRMVALLCQKRDKIIVIIIIVIIL